MSLITLYTQGMLWYMLAALPVYVLLRIIYLKTRAAKTNTFREVLLGVFALYLVGLASQTVLPPGQYGYDGTEWCFRPIIGTVKLVNWIPFRTILSYAFGSNSQVSDWSKVSSLNLLANILLFAPLGFFLPLVRQKSTAFFQIFVWGLGLSVSIEALQYFIGRSADIDDVLLNLVGICMGYAVLFIVRRAVIPGAHENVSARARRSIAETIEDETPALRGATSGQVLPKA